MHIVNEFVCWKVAYHLISDYKFELIQVDERNHEIWLKGTINKETKVVRLFQKGFDWANHLKRDIAFVMERIRKIQHVFKGRSINIYNVYLSQYHPVDDWEVLKKSISLKGKKNISAQTFYLDESNRENEMTRFFNELSIEPIFFELPSNEEEITDQIYKIKRRLILEQQQREKNIHNTFNYGKPILTYLLLAINIIIFFLLETSGSSTDTFHLIEWGAKVNPYIMDGEWWRIVSSMFLHIGYLHIIMNMLALYYLGLTVEKMYGSIKFLIIYFLAGLFGGLTSFAFNTSVAAGASGAIFGLFGALLFFGIQNRKLFFQTMGGNLLFIIGLNLVLGFSVPNIDMEAHLGGLLGGLLASGIVQMPKKNTMSIRIGSLIIFIALIIGLINVGIEQNMTSINPEIQHILAIEHLEKNEYEEAIKRFTTAINHSENKNEQLYYNRSIAYYHLEEWEKARDDLLEAIRINDKLAEAHYNLALVYVKLLEYEMAYFHADKAVTLKPNNQQFISVKESLKEFN